MYFFFYTFHIWLIWHQLALPVLERPIYSVAQSCLTLCGPMDRSPPGSSVHGIFQARILEWFAISFSRASFWLRDRIWVSCIAGRCFTIGGISDLVWRYHLKTQAESITFSSKALECSTIVPKMEYKLLLLDVSLALAPPENTILLSYLAFFDTTLPLSLFTFIYSKWVGFLGGSVAKNHLPMQETQVWSPGWEDPLEEEVATRSSIPAWRTPQTEEPGQLQSMGL